MMREGFIVLLSHWRRKPLQLATLLVGLALATALWSAVQAINGEARASYARAAAVVGQDRLESLVSPDGGRFSQKLYVDLRRAGWLVSPVIEGEKRLGGERVRIVGIDPLTLPPQARQVDVMGPNIGLKKFITPPGILVMSSETARRLEGIALPTVSRVDTLPPGTVMTDIGIAQSMLEAEGKISRLLLWPALPASAKPLEEVAPGLVRRQPAVDSDLSRLTDSFHLNLTAFGFLAFAVGIFIVHSAIGLAFEQRRAVFRTLRALGLPLRSLVMLLAVELLALAMISGLAGVALGYGVAWALLPDVAASLRGLYGAEVPGTLTIRPSVWLAGIGIAVAGTMVSAAGGLWRLWNMPLLSPARPRAWGLASEKAMRLQALSGFALLGVTGVLTQIGSGLVAGFVALAALLLGAALLLPPLLSSLLKRGARHARSVLGQWFWADTRQQLPGLSLALMALLLALSANAGVGTMVSSFRLTFVGWLDQRLASELYVTARNREEAQAIHDWLVPRSTAVLPIWNAESRIEGQPVQVYGIVDHATYRDNWPMLAQAPDAWDRIATSKAVLLNEQLARRSGLGLGDTVTLSDGVALPVAGVFSDYGNPKGQVIVSNDLLVKTFPDANRLRYAVRIDPAKATSLADDLRTAFGLPSENVIDQASVKSFSLRIFDRTFAVTAALNVLTLGVAALAIFASLLTLSGMRIPQLAPVWAMGLTRRHLAGLELLRSLALAALTMIVAIPVGIGLSWMLLAVVNVEAFGWRLPLHLFPLDWVRLAIFALLAAGIAAAVPAWRLARIPPAQLLKVFANES